MIAHHIIGVMKACAQQFHGWRDMRHHVLMASLLHNTLRLLVLHDNGWPRFTDVDMKAAVWESWHDLPRFAARLWPLMR